MIEVAGSYRRSFFFPGSLARALQFYGDLERLANYLPLIDMVERRPGDHFRMVYSATELGAYHIRIFADVQSVIDQRAGLLRVVTSDVFEPVQPRARFNSAVGQGEFRIESRFSPQGEGTQVDYELELVASLPRPKGMRFMPASMVNGITHSITNNRLQEIVEGFIANSLAAYPDWLQSVTGKNSTNHAF